MIIIDLKHSAPRPYGFRKTWFGYRMTPMRRLWRRDFWLFLFIRPGLWLVRHPQYKITGPMLLSHRLGFWLLGVGNAGVRRSPAW